MNARILAMHDTGLSPVAIAGMLRNDATPVRVSVATIKRVIRERAS